MLKVDIIHDLLQAAEAFSVPLRTGQGWNERRFQELCSVLRACAREWSDSHTVPKTAVNVIVDLFPAVESCSHLAFYQGEEAQRIRDGAMTLGDLIRDCFADNAHSN